MSLREWQEIQEVPRRGLTERYDKPRERLERLGVRALSDVELMALLVGSGQAERSAHQIASAIYENVDASLATLARWSARRLRSVDGIGPARASRIVAAMELGRRASRAPLDSSFTIRGARDVFVLMEPRLRDLRQEEFHVLLLSAQHTVLKDVLVTRGILNASLVHPREVFRAAIEHSAAAIVLVHNHPSGDPTPSPDDRSVTAQMEAAGAALGIPVLDHVVVARGRYASARSD